MLNNQEYIKEDLLLEKSRQDLINKSKKSDNYKDTSKGKNRWERRKLSKIAKNVKQYNDINMDKFFKKDILDVNINVKGETDDYIVSMRFNNILKYLSQYIQQGQELNFKLIIRALMTAFNSDNDVQLHCTCDDFKYRQDYWSTVGKYNFGPQQYSNGKKIANPNDTKGGGCKHTNLVIGNIEWLLKVASVINNYINYAKDYLQKAYADIIYPKLYGKKYEKDIQLSLTDTDDLDTGKGTIDDSNRIGRTRGQFRKGEIVNNQRIPIRKTRQEAPGQLSILGPEQEEDNNS